MLLGIKINVSHFKHKVMAFDGWANMIWQRFDHKTESQSRTTCDMGIW